MISHELIHFYAYVEPSLDGLARVVASMQDMDAEDVRPHFDAWVETINPGWEQTEEEFSQENIWPALWRALEGWHDGEAAGELLLGHFHHVIEEMGEITAAYAKRMTIDWADGWNRDALIDVFSSEEEDRAEEPRDEQGAPRIDYLYGSSGSDDDEFAAHGHGDAEAGSDDDVALNARAEHEALVRASAAFDENGRRCSATYDDDDDDDDDNGFS